uniref:Profilin n=1 Tax=Geotrypetes seraphini TaxID=260995 RepID=A0A6P8QFN5_GEOSA|nr:profilin-4 [Geotrypetes seraphini]XP_033794641.1 profilin-4 [Geotrypetes seraphini]XP_033794642.1 profilin-4 [Geotrypetes seraphini]XP_033794643.1 profilin-4 [Geotrypetes seraphini]XP_033794644.1 profilin-4 [Geotrypetes seraphini]XP_033794645.1 profilin-4 [Geotrypetes seraphini]XP_033794646.1 profilin-4 [Geotrypetes seraphini]XP_033794647.1 profilin-4 [Geotrypetes seraphini]XP_033794649.1 profilin-4 [Geotrypetes seraphini]XP_033794650.1 profilin-4 [Geotrypetes seraphini]
MNQLQNLLYDLLIKTKHVEHAALLNIKEKSVVASTKGFHMQPHQAEILLDAFKNTVGIRKDGIYFLGKFYKCIRADNYSIYAKKENQGFVAVKTVNCILVATYAEGMYPSVCVEAVEKFGDYIKEMESKRR